MNKLIVEKTRLTPEIKLDPATGVFEIKGRSIPENAMDLYYPIIDWLHNYSKKPAKATLFKVFFEYLNTSSSKYLFEVFRILEKISSGGYDVRVIWYYEGDVEEMKDTGEDYANLINIPFEVKTLEEEQN